MATILIKQQLSPQVWRLRLDAPRIANKRKAGQFVMLRPLAEGERIPLTIANANAAEGWIEIIFQVAGQSTTILSKLDIGETVADLAGPLGTPTHIENFGRCLCIGGGVGVAPLFPIVCALHDAGNEVTTIIGARNKNLIILEDDLKKQSDRLFAATDDGSAGTHGFVTTVLESLLDNSEQFDFAVIIGPVQMMKYTSRIAINAGIKTVCSLNPIMIDGTGMCGGCRVSIGSAVKFACVDGPEFDASLIAWDELALRLNTYKQFEKQSMDDHFCRMEVA